MEDILEQNVMSYEKIFILNEMNLQIIFVATPSTWLGVVTGYRRGPCARRVRKSSSKKCDREGGDRRLVVSMIMWRSQENIGHYMRKKTSTDDRKE